MRSELHLSEDYPGLAIFDCFKAHLTEAVSKLLEDNNIHLVIVPANCTDRLQPLDLSLNKPVKDFYANNLIFGVQSRFYHSWMKADQKTQLSLLASHGLPLRTLQQLG